MNTRIIVLFLFFLSISLQAQNVVTDTIKTSVENDSIWDIGMQEVLITNIETETLTADQKNLLAALKRRTLKVYPFAKIAAERLKTLNANMAKLKTKKEKKKYAKLVEKYMEDEFEAQLKKLSRKEGQILVKLIHRQTGETTFDLIKDHKSGWKAFWANRLAKLYNIDIKKKYSPATVPEDYHIEGFLIKAFQERRLVKQDPAFTIDYDEITASWQEKNLK
jgi:hypothetical protein